LKSECPSTADDGLTVEHKMPLPVLARSFDDARVALRQVVPASGYRPHAITITLKAQPVAVVFDLMKPLRSRRDGLCHVGKQNSNALKMG
jgi:hypothetical protein